MNRYVKRAARAVFILAILGCSAQWFWHRNGESAVAFRTASAERGDLMATISATGTVEPEAVVDVGARVAGKIWAFGKDQSGKPIDYGSVVEEGTVLAPSRPLLLKCP
jgi:HlyD family secretion protein